ncbi:hypothetical protein F5882DRAFT_394813 [Hyaloscypha sp. PMI_1271]|nr:hypothetical protein F5882DRAFT_394813 [Hyaloscypha sp. PMI_1271]
MGSIVKQARLVCHRAVIIVSRLLFPRLLSVRSGSATLSTSFLGCVQSTSTRTVFDWDNQSSPLGRHIEVRAENQSFLY